MTASYSLNFRFDPGLSAQVGITPGDGVNAPRTQSLDPGLIAKFALSLASTLNGVTNPAVAGVADAAFGQVYSIAGGGTQTIDLRSLTLLDGRTAQALARYKFLAFALLSTAQGGTACSGVSVGDAATNAHALFLSDATAPFVLDNGDFILHGKTGAAGEVVDATHKDVLVTNNDGAVAAAFLLLGIGGLS